MNHKLQIALLTTALGVAGLPRASAQAHPMEPPDPFTWLEQVSSPRAMAWVRAENARTMRVLERDPRYATLHAEARALAEARDRLPYPRIVGGQVYNFWQDAEHVHGIWRRTSLASYQGASPAWTTVLDLDALSRTEHANWFFAGADCAEPAQTRCLVSLSDGGEDAVTTREFDLATSRFVPGGFVIPHGKQSSSWVDANSILVAREWKSGDLTASGYPFIIKRVRRGEPLSAAVELFRGSHSDVFVNMNALHDGAGNHAMLLSRAPSFFESERSVVTPRGVERLAMPRKASVSGMVDGRVLVALDTAWTTAGTTYPAGSLVAVPLAGMLAHPDALVPSLVYAPGPRQSLNGVSVTRGGVVLTELDNVRGRAFVYQPTQSGGWTRTALALPDNLSINALGGDLHSSTAFLNVAGFLTPTSLWLVDASAPAAHAIKSIPAKFDASADTVEQLEATSSDGTRVPYFVVHRRGLTFDGSNPTILYAYGGFQVSETPGYNENVGKLWLERGGVYALANIRGGGEFGPAWHEAGLKTHRQLIYDDFAAVGRDLVARRITSPRRLGIQGGSNGGLLMGVEFTQHPELWNAVDIQVPLLDMLRFEQIAAGASWVGEYGSVTVPAERAFLASISPYANLRAGVKYPEPFIWTTTKDDRVGPQHARKFAARLAAMGIPYLFYEVIQGGHGAGASLDERAQTTALEMTYFTRQLM